MLERARRTLTKVVLPVPPSPTTQDHNPITVKNALSDEEKAENARIMQISGIDEEKTAEI